MFNRSIRLTYLVSIHHKARLHDLVQARLVDGQACRRRVVIINVIMCIASFSIAIIII